LKFGALEISTAFTALMYIIQAVNFALSSSSIILRDNSVRQSAVISFACARRVCLFRSASAICSSVVSWGASAHSGNLSAEILLIFPSGGVAEYSAKTALSTDINSSISQPALRVMTPTY